jgi:DNA (cytosine-5)-methyltransferase 1
LEPSAGAITVSGALLLRMPDTAVHNRPGWPVIQGDIRTFDARPYRGTDLAAAGLPCPPFTSAGRQLGEADERNLFPAAFRIIQEAQPEAVMIENVRASLTSVLPHTVI